MNAERCPSRARVHGLIAVTLCTMLGGLAASARADSIKVGTVLAVPLNELENFRLANSRTGRDFSGSLVPANDVTVLHVAPGGGPFNTSIVTVSLTQKGSGLKSWRVFFPIRADSTISPLYQQMNARDSFSNVRIINNGISTVAQVDVRQKDTGNVELENTRFMLLPLNAVFRLAVENPTARLSPVHVQYITIGSRSMWTELVGIDAGHARELKIPKEMTAEVEVLNSNITITPGNLASTDNLASVR